MPRRSAAVAMLKGGMAIEVPWPPVDGDPWLYTTMMQEMGAAGVQVEELYTLDMPEFEAVAYVEGGWPRACPVGPRFWGWLRGWWQWGAPLLSSLAVGHAFLPYLAVGVRREASQRAFVGGRAGRPVMACPQRIVLSAGYCRTELPWC